MSWEQPACGVVSQLTELQQPVRKSLTETWSS